MLKLKQLRKKNKMSQSEVARILGITQQAYANYERGARQADYTSLKILSDFFNVSVDYLLGFESNDDTSLDHEIREVINNPSEDIKELIKLINQMTPEEQQHLLDFAKLDAKYQAKKNKKNTPTE